MTGAGGSRSPPSFSANRGGPTIMSPPRSGGGGGGGSGASSQSSRLRHQSTSSPLSGLLLPLSPRRSPRDGGRRSIIAGGRSKTSIASSPASAAGRARMRRARAAQPYAAPVVRRTPMLTIILMRMEEVVAEYCRLLAGCPSPADAAAAASLLDSSGGSSTSTLRVAFEVVPPLVRRQRERAGASSVRFSPSLSDGESEGGGESERGGGGGSASPRSTHSAPALRRSPRGYAKDAGGKNKEASGGGDVRARFAKSAQTTLRRSSEQRRHKLSLSVPYLPSDDFGGESGEFSAAGSSPSSSPPPSRRTKRGHNRLFHSFGDSPPERTTGGGGDGNDPSEKFPPRSSSSASVSSSTSTTSSLTASGSAMAMESEFERFTSPLILFAGAEALYAQLDHVFADGGGKDGQADDDGGGGCEDEGRGDEGDDDDRRHNPLNPGSSLRRQRERAEIGNRSKKLLAMYRKAAADMAVVRSYLCDPLLGGEEGGGGGVDPSTSTSTSTSASSPSSSGGGGAARRISASDTLLAEQSRVASVRAALSLSDALLTLEAVASVRCDVVSVHADLFLFGGGGEGGRVRGPSGGGIRGGGVTAVPTVSPSSLPSPTSVASSSSPSVDCRGDIDDRGDGLICMEGEGRDDAWSAFLSGLAETCEELRRSLPDNDGAGSPAALPIIGAIGDELAALSAALSSAEALERCRFFETVLNVKKLKESLLSPSSKFYSPTPQPLQRWLLFILNHLRSKMTLYFDRIETFSTSFYGFKHGDGLPFRNAVLDERFRPTVRDGSVAKRSGSDAGSSDGSVAAAASSGSGGENFDEMIQNFLLGSRKQDGAGRGGAPPVAVALILDADCGSLPDFERGFMCEGNRNGESGSSKNFPSSNPSRGPVDGLRSWPAIYLRSSSTYRKVLGRGKKLPSSDQKRERSKNDGGVPQVPLPRLKHTRSATISSIGFGMDPPNLHKSTSIDGGFLSSLFDREPRRAAAVEKKPWISHNLPPRVRASSDSEEKGRSAALMRQDRDGHDASGPSSSTTRIGVDPVSKRNGYWPSVEDSMVFPYVEWPSLVSILTDYSRRRFAQHYYGAAVGEAFTHREKRNESRRSKRRFPQSNELSPRTFEDDDAETSVSSGQGPPTNVKDGRRAQFPSISSLMSLLDGPTADAVPPQPSPSVNDPAANSPSSQSRGLSGIDRMPSFAFGSGQGHGDVNTDPLSVYHIAQVGTKLWLVILLKEEDTKLLRRKPKAISDDEARRFLNNMSAMLKISRMFRVEAVASARREARKTEAEEVRKYSGGLSITKLWAGGWHDIDSHQLIGSLKKTFGLKPTSHFVQPLWSPCVTASIGSPSRRSTIDSKHRNVVNRSESIYSIREGSSTMSSDVDIDEQGAFSFFLGSELSKVLL